MRIVPVAALLLVAAFGSADQFLSIPTGAKVPFKAIKLDFAMSPSAGFRQSYADIGIGTSFEMTLRAQRPLDLSTVGTFDIAYNYISPIAGIIPGISFGMQDTLDQSPTGRRVFIAATSRQIYSTESGDSPGDVTIGLFEGRHSSIFVGLDIPLSTYLRLVACHDGSVITAGLEFRTTRNLGLRFVAVDGRPQIGISTMKQF